MLSTLQSSDWTSGWVRTAAVFQIRIVSADARTSLTHQAWQVVLSLLAVKDLRLRSEQVA